MNILLSLKHDFEQDQRVLVHSHVNHTMYHNCHPLKKHNHMES